MCGRFVASANADEIADFFEARFSRGWRDQPADFNVAPTRHITVVYEDGVSRLVSRAHWGLIPSWAQDPSVGVKMINARSETIAEKPSFRDAFAQRRCLIPADGFYEWLEASKGDSKQPWYITRTDGEMFAFAAIWEQWRNPEAPEVRVVSTSIITQNASGPLSEIHHRQPVALERNEWNDWLNVRNNNVAALSQMVQHQRHLDVSLVRVSTAVNSTANNSPELTQAVPPDPEQLSLW